MFNFPISAEVLFVSFLVVLCVGYIFVEILFGEKYPWRSSFSGYGNKIFDRCVHYIIWGVILNVGLLFSSIFSSALDEFITFFNQSLNVTSWINVANNLDIRVLIFGIFCFILRTLVFVGFEIILRIVKKIIQRRKAKYLLAQQAMVKTSKLN